MADKFFGKDGPAFSHKSVEWETPDWLFDRLDADFHFTLDVCATEANAKCDDYYAREDDGACDAVDGLAQDWGREVCFCNPPFGRGTMTAWLDKARRAAHEDGARVVCLIPSRTETRWFTEIVMPFAAHVWFVKGRIKFLVDGKEAAPAPFPSAIALFVPLMWKPEFSQREGPTFDVFDPKREDRFL